MNPEEIHLEEGVPESLSARAAALAGCVRQWREIIGRALDEHAARDDEERLEFLAGYIDPYFSWEAILVESARSFPGAAARFRDVCDEMACLLDEVSARETFLKSAGLALDSIRACMHSVHVELSGTSETRVGQRLAELDESMERLELLVGAFELTLRDRRCLEGALGLDERKAEG